MSIKIKSIIPRNSILDKQNKDKSIQNELIYTIKRLYNLEIEIIHSSSSNEKNLIQPILVVSKSIIFRNNIYFFFKYYLQSSKSNIFNEENEKFLERQILIDLQNLLFYYTTFQSYDSQLLNILSFIIQPLYRIQEYLKEKEAQKSLSKYCHVTSKFECLQKIKEINSKINSILSLIDSKHIENQSTSNLLILLVYSSFVIQKQILQKEDFDEVLNSDLTSYRQCHSIVSQSLVEERKFQIEKEITEADVGKVFPNEECVMKRLGIEDNSLIDDQEIGIISKKGYISLFVFGIFVMFGVYKRKLFK